MSRVLSVLLVLMPCILFAQEENNGQDESEGGAVVEKYQKMSEANQVNAILIDRQNNKWMGTNKGLFRFTSMTSDPDILTESFGVYALAQSKDGRIWAGTDGNAIVDQDMNVLFQFEQKDLTIKSMAFFRGLLWVGTNQGLFTYNPSTGRTGKTYNVENSKLKSDQINMLFADPYDQLWIGTDKGIVQSRKGKITAPMEEGHQFLAATHTKEGIWLVSNKELWVVNMKESNRGRWYPADIKRDLSKGRVRGISSDSKGRLYLASEIVVQFDPYNDKTVAFDEDYGFTSADALALVCDKNDDVWIGTANRGVYRVDLLDGKSVDLRGVAYIEKEVTCNGRENGIVGIKVHGGEKPIKIKWSNGKQNLNRLTSLGAGTYGVTLTDAVNSEYTTSVTLTEPSAIQVQTLSNVRVSALRARDGEISVDVSGGTPPYQLRWNNGKRGVTKITGLPYGEYNLYVTDENRCTAEKTFKVDKPKVLPQLDVTTIEVGQTLRINELFFKADSATVEQESFAVLDEIFDFLNANDKVIVEIGGHTNGIPPHDYCDRLSTERARNVAAYLYEKGIKKDQITYRGYGKRQPIATNNTKQGRQKNQRVELKILSIKS